MRALIAIAALLALPGCYAFKKAEDVHQVTLIKIESRLAIEFCSALLQAPRRGCAIRTRNTETNTHHCVVVILPNDADAAAHEGGHCMGYDH